MPNITVSLPADLYLEISQLKNKSAIVTAALKKHIHPIITQKEYHSAEYRKEHNIKMNLKRGSTDSFEAERDKQIKAQNERITKLIQEQEQERIHREDIRKQLENEVKKGFEEKIKQNLKSTKGVEEKIKQSVKDIEEALMSAIKSL